MDPALQAALRAHPPYPDVNIGDRYMVTLCVTFFFVLFTLALRLYTRITITKSTGWDDWTAIVATVSPRCCLCYLLICTNGFSYVL
jgi:hypothetical protein